MGWLYTRGFSKADVIREVTSPKPFDYQGERVETVVLDQSTQGNALWVVFERTFTNLTTDAKRVERFIELFLLQSGRESGWGYKDMSASSHPFTYSCPERFFDLVKTPECVEWREGVHRYWRAVKARKAMRKALVPGATVKLTACRIPEVTITSLQGRKILGTFEGQTYRIPLRAIAIES